MLCDELWMMCVKIHQQDLLLEAARHALQQSVLAHRPRRQRPWRRALSHALSGCRARLRAFWWRRRLRQAGEPEALWDPAEELAPCQKPHHDLAVATVRTMRAPQPTSLRNAD